MEINSASEYAYALAYCVSTCLRGENKVVECVCNLPQVRDGRQWRINPMLGAVCVCVCVCMYMHVKIPPMGEHIYSRSLSSRVPLPLCVALRTHALSRFARLRARLCPARDNFGVYIVAIICEQEQIRACPVR